LVITGTRAEYGLLRWVIDGIANSRLLELQLCATGMHLSPEFGLTYREIEKDGYQIDSKVEMLVSADTPSGITKSMGLGLIGFADELERLKPDLLILLGDRYEIMAAAMAATLAKIPIAHLHGGEVTEGAFDEAIRHSLTKMSHIHFVAVEEYRDRVIQLGESPGKVHCVGGLGIDNINRIKLLSREELEDAIGFKLGAKNLLVTFHPVTLDEDSAWAQIQELLDALSALSDTSLIFTMPNADTGNRRMSDSIKEFVADHANAVAFSSLGQLRYLSCMQHVDAVVGNSSSGLLEAPSFKKATVNIGDRQKGRVQAESVVDCQSDQDSIRSAIEGIYSPLFQKELETVKNPYDKGGSSDLIVKTIEQIDLSGILKKQFHDLPRDLS
jgi:GDP/UDP-N,N'-diacetylbacillosamine 2-epimerase (hydrolysing)